VWHFQNNGLNDLPNFTLMSKNLFQSSQLDFGTGAAPSVVDADADGLMDIVVTNKLSYQNGTSLPSRAALLRNVGTASNPAFELVDSNWQNLAALNVRSLHLAFGDLDGDGDTDAVTGMEDGYLRVLSNTAGVGQPLNLVPDAENLSQSVGPVIDIGQNSTPQLFDLNSDGLLDLLVGEKNGNINYYANTGSTSGALFSLVEDSLGDVIANQSFGINGYSVPHFYRKPNGQLALLVGSETGYLSAYENIDGNLNGTFSLVSNAYGDWREGDRSAIVLHDFTGDEMPEMIYGQIGGGLGYYAGIPVGVEELLLSNLNMWVYPNPSNEWANVVLSDDALVKLFDLRGSEVYSAFLKSGVNTLPTAALADGMYLLSAQSKNAIASYRLIIRHEGH
jgi:hypothetical protein